MTGTNGLQLDIAILTEIDQNDAFRIGVGAPPFAMQVEAVLVEHELGGLAGGVAHVDRATVGLAAGGAGGVGSPASPRNRR